MSHLQATHTHQAALQAAPPCPAQWGRQQAARAVWSLVSRFTSRCASSEVARDVGAPGRAQWAPSLRPASSGSAGRASTAAPRAADFEPAIDRPARERIDAIVKRFASLFAKSWRGVTYVVLLTRAWPGVSRLVPFAPGALCLGGGKAPKTWLTGESSSSHRPATSPKESVLGLAVGGCRVPRVESRLKREGRLAPARGLMDRCRCLWPVEELVAGSVCRQQS